jgi:MoaA/NifB/PqqE/SkfB family radical SAM enzyme
LNLYLKDFVNLLLGKQELKYVEVLPLWGCDAKCPTCGSWKRPDDVRLSKKQAESIVNYPFGKLEKVTIEGGEPTIWEHLEWFVSNMIERHKIDDLAIITNGLNWKHIKTIGQNLKKYQPILRWAVSFNGMGTTHDYSRGTKNAFEKTSATIKCLKDTGYEVRLSFAPFVKNYQEYEAVREYANGLGIKDIGVCYPTASTKFGENLKAQVIDEVEFDKFYKRYLTFCSTAWRWSCEYLHWHIQRKKLMCCNSGQYSINIMPNGYISPCCFREDGIIGRVTDEVMELYPDKIKEIAKELKSAKCAYNDRTVCGDCFLVRTIRHNVPKLLLWKLCHPIL